MKKIKKAIPLILCLTMCLMLLAACGGSGDSGTSPAASSQPGTSASPSAPPSPGATAPGGESGGEAVGDVAEEGASYADHIEIIIDNNRISVINPMIPGSNITPSHWIMFMIYDRLVYYDETAQIFLPALATEWSTDDYITFRFKLRDDVYFHNGEHFTAQDIAGTRALAEEATGTMMSSQWRPVETVNIINDYEVELVLGSINVDFLMNLAQPQAGILNKKAVDADPENGPLIGTGPFTVTDFLTNEHTSLERFDGFWGELAPTRSITMRFIPEVSARATMMLNGEAQLCFSISSEDMHLFENDSYNIFPLIMNNPQGLSFNMQHPITGDRNFRMAVLHAMNRTDIATVAAGDWAWGISDEYYGESVWGIATAFRSILPVYGTDPDLAKEYLAQSSYNGEVIQITASVSTNVKGAEILQQQLSAVGINSEINETDTAGLNAQYGTPDHHIIYHGITFTYAAGSANHVYIPGGAQNRGNYDNPEVTRLLTEAAVSLNETDRAALYHEAQQLIYEDMPFANILWRLNGVVGTRGIGGLILPNDTHSTQLRGLYWIVD